MRTGRKVTAGSGPHAWVRGHADVLRVAGVVVAALVALLLSSWASLFVAAAALAAYEAAITLALRDGSSPRRGEADTGTGTEPAAGRAPEAGRQA